MLSARPYLRDDDYPRERTSVLIWLLSGIVAGFVLQVGLTHLSGAANTESLVALSIPVLKKGYVWTLLTYSFLHSTSFLPHVVINALALYFLGRSVLPVLGTRRFLAIYFTAIVAGGLGWAALHWSGRGAQELVGATAGVDALLVIYACFYPNQRLEVLLFFVAPIRITPKQLAYGVMLVDLVGLVLYESQGTGPYNLAAPLPHSAHLAGMLVGWLYFRYFHESRFQTAARVAEVEMATSTVARKAGASAASPAFHLNLSNPNDVRAEVDRILDKINSHGLGALSAEEKRFLDEARNGLNKG